MPPRSFTVYRIVLILLSAALLFVPLAPPAGTPEHLRSPELDLVSWWNEQALAAEQVNQPEVALTYKTRIEAFSKSSPSPGVSSQENVGMASVAAVPQMLTAELYERLPNPQPAQQAVLTKHEPASGTYLGMLGADRRVGYDVTKIESVYGRRHAIYLAYVGWRKFQTDTNSYFPIRTAERVKAMGGALQIGWEPRYGLEDVKDDEYIRTFAREAKASGIPIFLRYASEMNGAWVPWHGNPQLYVEKFRLVHDIMESDAPNVAMVWSPNFAPADTIDDYYPGDAYVDWVGFSLYSTPLANGKEQLRGNVIDDFAPLYAKYDRKPIMISEGAVAHTVLATDTAYWQWAEGQLAYMYGVLPRLFPMVKAMTYFNFSRAQALRSKMDYVYDLGENFYTDALYKRLIRSEWFVDHVEEGIRPVSYHYAQITRSIAAGKHQVMVYTQLEDGSVPFAVALFQGNRRLGISYEMPWEMSIQVDSDSLAEPYMVIAYNERMEPVAKGSLSPR
jgi:hypothetical protein